MAPARKMAAVLRTTGASVIVLSDSQDHSVILVRTFICFCQWLVSLPILFLQVSNAVLNVAHGFSCIFLCVILFIYYYYASTNASVIHTLLRRCIAEDMCLPPEGQEICNGRGTHCNSTVTSFSMATGEYTHEFSCDCTSNDPLVTYSGPTCGVSLCNGTFECLNGGHCE